MTARRAASLESRSRFFDAHCDTAMKTLDAGADFLSPTSPAHVSLPRLESAGVCVQAFACCAVYPERPEEDYVERGEAMIAAVTKMAADSGGRMVIAATGGALLRAVDGGAIAAVVGLEGADPLEGRAENLRRFAERGVRQLIPAWKDNAFSGTAFGTNAPLSREGGRLLGLAGELGVVVDVSHLSDRAFDDVCEQSVRPFIASHSNCRSICPHSRNLTDAMIRRLADCGGVMGVNLAPHFLDAEFSAAWATIRGGGRKRMLPDRERAESLAKRAALPKPGLEAVVRHVKQAMRVGGEDVVGLGGDLDGIEQLPRGIESVADYPRLVPLLRTAGLSDRQLEKLCYRNFLRVFVDVLPN